MQEEIVRELNASLAPLGIHFKHSRCSRASHRGYIANKDHVSLYSLSR